MKTAEDARRITKLARSGEGKELELEIQKVLKYIRIGATFKRTDVVYRPVSFVVTSMQLGKELKKRGFKVKYRKSDDSILIDWGGSNNAPKNKASKSIHLK